MEQELTAWIILIIGISIYLLETLLEIYAARRRRSPTVIRIGPLEITTDYVGALSIILVVHASLRLLGVI